MAITGSKISGLPTGTLALTHKIAAESAAGVTEQHSLTDLASTVGGAYDIGLDHPATPTSSEVIGSWVVPRAITLPADLAGSGGSVTSNPAGSFAIDLQDDAASIGTITISTGGAFTFVTAGNLAKTVAAGSLLTMVAPAADASIAGIVITLKGSY